MGSAKVRPQAIVRKETGGKTRPGQTRGKAKGVYIGGAPLKASALPVAAKPQPEFAQVEMEDVREKLGTEFEKLGAEIIELQAEIAVIEERMKEKRLLAQALMEEISSDVSWSARAPGWSVTYVVPAPRKTLVPELLVQQGVSLTVIKRATKETPASPYVTFRKTKESA